MTPHAHSEEHPWTPGRLRRLAWMPILLLLTAIVAARLAGLRGTYESHLLLLVLSFTFYTLVSLGTLYIVGRSFLGLGSPSLLLLECGVILWSLAGTVGDFVSHGDANINVTIFNTGILIAGLCHLAGTILSLRPQRALRARPLWLTAGCAAALAALWLVAQAALMGWLPVFFVPGSGGTPVRYVVLSSAIAMFVLSAGLLKAGKRGKSLPFTSWYSMALLMLAVGLFGVMIQLSLGSLVNWLSRTAQWAGGVYLLFAAFASLSESQLPLLPLQKESNPAYYRDAVAVALVVAAAAIRLTFLAALGMQAPFVTFYPAVIFAAIYGGLRAGLLATALSALFTNYFWMEPVGRLAIVNPSDWLAVMVFLLTGSMIAGVSEAMHRARVRAFAAEKQALQADERAAAAEALQESRARLEAAMASMTDAVFISDKEGRFIDFNDAFATFHRFGNKDECAKTFAEYPDILDVFIGDGADGTPAPPDQWAVPRALRGETVTNAEYTLRRKDTGETWVGSYSFAPIRDKDGAIAGSVVAARDITERKKIGAELQRQREWLRVTLGSIGDAVIATDTEGKVAFMNAVAETLTGWTLPEASGRPVAEVFHIVNEHTRQAVESPVDRVLREGVIVGLANHTILIRRDGTEVPIDDSGAPIRDAGGVTLGVVLVFRDIAERKQAEEALRFSEEKFAAAFANNPAAIALTRLDDGVFLEVNDTWMAMNGYSREEMIGRSARGMGIWPTAEAASRFVRELREKGFVQGWEQEFHRKSGEVFVAQLSAQALTVRGEKAVLSTLVDITKRKRAEEALRESEALLRRQSELLEHAPVLVRNLRDEIILWNSGMEKMYGYSCNEALGQISHDLLRTRHPQPLAEIIAHLHKEGQWEGELRHQTKDGEHIIVTSLQILHRDTGGNADAIIEVNRDITKRKLAEEELRERTRQLEEANQELESFSYTVSHDLRAPLRTINGYIRMILKTHGGVLDADALSRFNVIRSSTVTMGQLIDDLLDFSRLSRARLSMAELDMEGLFQEAWKDVAENGGGRTDLKIAPLPPGRGDRTLVKQVIGNLLANAVKFSAGRSEPRIETGGYREGRECVYYVRDNGVGFDMQYHDKLFGVFSRLHAADEFEGTGVGLAIVQRIVQRHGGRVWAEGREGEGAAFYFTLPCHKQNAVI